MYSQTSPQPVAGAVHGASGATTARGGGKEPSRFALPALLLVTALLYLWNLSASGYANSFYSAAVQAGSQSWKALFFGSLDAGNAITVDKPPAALWPMALSVRVFGLSSWAILVPEVLMGVATVAVLYGAVRRRFGAAAGLIAGTVLALTPVAALMFRFNNPDALLTLLMTVTVYCVLRALEDGRTRWLVWAGVAVGLAFLTKTLQAFLILPPLAVLYAVCAPVRPLRRAGQLLLSGLVTVAAGGWWVAVVELWPASSRPYIGGSQHNSFLELTFGYNGLGRINGDETGSVGGGGGPGGGAGGQWGETGLTRMFGAEVGAQIAWLLPAALILFAAGIALTWRAKRTDAVRAAFLAWGGALLATAAVFSFMAGIFHQYYTVALAPYIAALVGMGATVLWEERTRLWPRLVLAGTVAVSAIWAYVLLDRTPDYLPWLRWAVLVAGIGGALGLLLAPQLGRRAALTAVALSLTACLAAPLAYTLSTVNTGHTGSIVTAGPAGASGMGGPGGGPRAGGPGGAAGGMGGPGGAAGGMGGRGGAAGGTGGPGGAMGGGPGGNAPGGGMGQFPGPGGGNGGAGRGAAGAQPPVPGRGNSATGPGAGGLPGGGRLPGERGGRSGAMGGLLDGPSVSARAEAMLKDGAGDYTWTAATVGSQNAASYQLATGTPVMAIGGFNGSDPSPTLAQFKQYVEDGRIHYFLSSSGGRGGGMGGPGGRSGGTASRITTWVEATFKKVKVGDATFYDLTRKKDIP
ncbi:ArnT family glycosyltransferase [Streptomyces sp. NPDC002004]